MIWSPVTNDPEDFWTYYDGQTQYGGTQYGVQSFVYTPAYGFVTIDPDSWMPNPSVYGAMGAISATETIYNDGIGNPVDCAGMPDGPAYFGAENGRGSNAGTVLEANTGSPTWHDIFGWSGYETAINMVYEGTPLSALWLSASDDAFQVTGGG